MKKISGFHVGRATIAAILGGAAMIAHAASEASDMVMASLKEGKAKYAKQFSKPAQNSPYQFISKTNKDHTEIVFSLWDNSRILGGQSGVSSNQYRELREHLNDIEYASRQLGIEVLDPDLARQIRGILNAGDRLSGTRNRPRQKPDRTPQIIGLILESIKNTANSDALLERVEFLVAADSVKNINLGNIAKENQIFEKLANGGFTVADKSYAYADVAKTSYDFFAPYKPQGIILFDPNPLKQKTFSFASPDDFFADVNKNFPFVSKGLREALREQAKKFPGVYRQGPAARTGRDLTL